MAWAYLLVKIVTVFPPCLLFNALLFEKISRLLLLVPPHNEFLLKLLHVHLRTWETPKAPYSASIFQNNSSKISAKRIETTSTMSSKLLELSGSSTAACFPGLTIRQRERLSAAPLYFRYVLSHIRPSNLTAKFSDFIFLLFLKKSQI